MIRLQALTPLILMLAALGCSAERDQQTSRAPAAPQPTSSTGIDVATLEPAADRVAQRPEMRPETPALTTELPLWPQAAPPAPPPAIISPPNALPPVPAGPPWTGGAGGTANSDNRQPSTSAGSPPVPPLPPLLPMSTADVPPRQPEPGDENPLRETTPIPNTQAPRIPRIPEIPTLPALPVAPDMGNPSGNPLRSADAVPLLPMAPSDTAKSESVSRWNQMSIAPSASAPIGSGAPAAPITTLPQLPKPVATPPREQLLPHAPADASPPKRSVQEAGEAIVKSTPPRLPRVSIYSSAKARTESAAPVRAPLSRSALAPPAIAPEAHIPSGGAAPPEVLSQPKMVLSPGARTADLPFVNLPPAASESAIPPAMPSASPPPPPPPPLPATASPPSADATPAADVPDPLPPFPAASPGSAATAPAPPGLVEPTFEPQGSVPEEAPLITAPASDAPPFPMLPEATSPVETSPEESSAEASFAPLAPSTTSPETAPPAVVASPTSNEPYEIIRVFYGTDRRPILVNEDTLFMRIVRFLPAAVLIALSAVGIGVVVVSRKVTWTIGTCALVVLSALASWHGVSETITIAQQAALEEPTYSADKSDRGRIERGICEVSIPKIHEAGELETPSRFRFERVDISKHITLRKTTRLQDETFYAQIRQQVASSPDKEILIFVHGFNVSFEDAARRTGQMAKDLKMQGAPVFYSWPADKYFLLTYGKDESSVGWSAPHLKEFLLDLVHHTDAQSINLVAHSMGNRALTTALREIDLQLKDEARLFNQVVLAAPDIDADDFRDNIAPAIQRTAKQVTLYASSRDVALSASRFLHRNPRAGDTSRGLVIVPGVDTIDVSNIDGGPWGHSYYGASDPVLRDLHLLLTSLPPERRTWLNEKQLDGHTYWAFKPLGTARAPALVEPR